MSTRVRPFWAVLTLNSQKFQSWVLTHNSWVWVVFKNSRSTLWVMSFESYEFFYRKALFLNSFKNSRKTHKQLTSEQQKFKIFLFFSFFLVKFLKIISKTWIFAPELANFSRPRRPPWVARELFESCQNFNSLTESCSKMTKSWIFRFSWVLTHTPGPLFEFFLTLENLTHTPEYSWVLQLRS